MCYVDRRWRLMATADLDHDGLSDLVFQGAWIPEHFGGLAGVRGCARYSRQESRSVNSLLAKLSNAAKKFNSGDCMTAKNIYQAFINEVQAQTGKGISEAAAAILIADAEYLIANCP